MVCGNLGSIWLQFPPPRSTPVWPLPCRTAKISRNGRVFCIIVSAYFSPNYHTTRSARWQLEVQQKNGRVRGLCRRRRRAPYVKLVSTHPDMLPLWQQRYGREQRLGRREGPTQLFLQGAARGSGVIVKRSFPFACISAQSSRGKECQIQGAGRVRDVSPTKFTYLDVGETCCFTTETRVDLNINAPSACSPCLPGFCPYKYAIFCWIVFPIMTNGGTASQVQREANKERLSEKILTRWWSAETQMFPLMIWGVTTNHGGRFGFSSPQTSWGARRQRALPRRRRTPTGLDQSQGGFLTNFRTVLCSGRRRAHGSNL